MKRLGLAALVAATSIVGGTAAFAARPTCTQSIEVTSPVGGSAYGGTLVVAWTYDEAACAATTLVNVEAKAEGPWAAVNPAPVSIGSGGAGSYAWSTAGALESTEWHLRITVVGTTEKSHLEVPFWIDNTAPAISYVGRTPANEAGWNSTDVVAEWSCTDSGVGFGPAAGTNLVSATTATLSTEGAAQSVTGTCADMAGNSASDTVDGINVDKTAPAITLVSRTAANEAGWNSTDVVVEWSCTDALSGVAAGPAAQTVSTDGAGQSATGTCADVAGNVASDTVGGINVDKTAPVPALVSITEPNTNGWNNTDVTAIWSCSDATSGAVEETVSATLTAEGRDQTASATCADLAGNTAAASATGIDIDKTIPVATVTGPGVASGTLGLPVNGTAVDNLSGVETVMVTFTDALGVSTTVAATCTGCGTSAAVSWQAVPESLLPGLYDVTAVATDYAGNVSAASEPATYLIVA